MKSIRHGLVLSLLATAALAPLSPALAASCSPAGASDLPVGTVAAVPVGAARSYKVNLGAGEGVIIDLSNLVPVASPTRGDGDDHEHEHGEGRRAASPPPLRSLALCDASGNLLAPQRGEVFEKGGSVTSTPDGERLRFVAQAAGQYIVSVTGGDAARELLVRRRDVGSARAPVVSSSLDSTQKGITASTSPMVFSFIGAAGQWVELKSTSEKDTLLRLAGPDRSGDYSVIAENDDSDGLNPIVRRKLPLAGTYFVQVDSLSDEHGEFELALKRIAAPKPLPPPMALRLGGKVDGKLESGDTVQLYTLPVVAGHSYRLELTAPYDGVVAIGLPNPVEPEDGGDKPDSGFSEVKSQDGNLTGTERLNFTARTSGQLMVRIKSFGIGETDGAFTLLASDLGS